jgi:hypothetical protein
VGCGSLVCKIDRSTTPARYLDPRPLVEDDSIRSQDSLIFNARADCKFDNGVRLQLEMLDLLKGKANENARSSLTSHESLSYVAAMDRRIVCISKICIINPINMDLVKFQVALLAAHPPDNVEASTRFFLLCSRQP